MDGFARYLPHHPFAVPPQNFGVDEYQVAFQFAICVHEWHCIITIAALPLQSQRLHTERVEHDLSQQNPHCRKSGSQQIRHLDSPTNSAGHQRWDKLVGLHHG